MLGPSSQPSPSDKCARRADDTQGLFYTDVAGFSLGCICTFLACVVTAFQTGTDFAIFVCYGLGTLTLFRVALVGLYGRSALLRRIPDAAWERVYATSGMLHVALVGVWPLSIFAASQETSAQLFSFGTAICFLVGLVARNFGSPALVRRQLLAGALPMIVALTIPGDIRHLAFAGFFGVFCFTLLRISDGMWRTFRRAIEAAEENERLAFSDMLTGLPNRSEMTRRIEAAVARRQGDFAVHFIDLDRFKRLNDSYGHAFGDRVLIEAAARMSELIEGRGTLARFAGDEFVILQDEIAAEDDAEELARAVIAALGRPMRIDGISLSVASSVGVALYPRDAATFSSLIQRADTALYAAKDAGRGRHIFFDETMEHREQERLLIEADLRAAIGTEQMFLVFQPIVDCRSNKVASCEALLRWNHPHRGSVSPAAFLPIAEECGLMAELTDLTLRQACATAAEWPAGIGVAVNLSPSQLDRSDIVDTILSSADDAGLERGHLEIEITENLFLHQDDAVLDKLNRLRGSGIRFSLDDFGTGYSNLGYLSRLPLDKIKIDRSFVVRAVSDPADRALLHGMIRLIHALDLGIVVEGIENERQLHMVMEEELVEELQGFIFGQPLPRAAIVDLLKALDVRSGPQTLSRKALGATGS